MAKALGLVALVAVTLTLGSALVAIWGQLPPKDDLLELTQLLLSWKVITGGLVLAGVKTFEEEIKGVLKRIGKA